MSVAELVDAWLADADRGLKRLHDKPPKDEKERIRLNSAWQTMRGCAIDLARDQGIYGERVVETERDDG